MYIQCTREYLLHVYVFIVYTQRVPVLLDSVVYNASKLQSITCSRHPGAAVSIALYAAPAVCLICYMSDSYSSSCVFLVYERGVCWFHHVPEGFLLVFRFPPTLVPGGR